MVGGRRPNLSLLIHFFTSRAMEVLKKNVSVEYFDSPMIEFWTLTSVS